MLSIVEKKIPEAFKLASSACHTVDTGFGPLPLLCQLKAMQLLSEREEFLKANPNLPKLEFKCIIMREGLKFSDIVLALEHNGIQINMPPPLSPFRQQFEDWEKEPIKKTSISCISEVLKDERKAFNQNQTIEILENHCLEQLTVFETLSYYAFDKSNSEGLGNHNIPTILTSTPYDFPMEFAFQSPKYIAGVGFGEMVVIQPTSNSNSASLFLSLQGKMCLPPKK